MASIMSAGHSTALNRSLRLCRNECMTHPSETRGFKNLFNAALAELALHLVSLWYFGKANWWFCFTIRFAVQSEAPTSGICLALKFVFSPLQGCSIRLMWGVSVSRLMSNVCKPQASDKRIAVSPIKAINHRGSSSKFRHSDCNWVQRSFGMGNFCFNATIWYESTTEDVFCGQTMFPYRWIDDGPHWRKNAFNQRWRQSPFQIDCLWNGLSLTVLLLTDCHDLNTLWGNGYFLLMLQRIVEIYQYPWVDYKVWKRLTVCSHSFEPYLYFQAL